MTMNRRLFLAGLSSVGSVPFNVLPSRAAVRLTIRDSGGPTGAAFRKAFYDPFEKEAGIAITNVSSPHEPTALIKAMVESGSYTWNVAQVSAAARDIAIAQDLVSPIGARGEYPSEILEGGYSSHWLASDAFAHIMVFRKDRFPRGGPRSWAEFWDVKAFPGRRSLYKSPIDTLEQALLADGVGVKDLYPLDVDRAFRSLDRIKEHVSVWWTNGAQATQLLQTGEVDVGTNFNARAQSLIDNGMPLEIVWNQGIYSLEGFLIPRGAPHYQEALAFIKFMADAKRQAAFTETLSYGPSNLRAYDSIPVARAKTLPTYRENLSLMAFQNSQWWGQNRARVEEKFSRWILN